MLRAAVIAAIGISTATQAAELTFTTDADGNTLWNVGYGLTYDENGNPIGLSDDYRIHEDFIKYDATENGVSGYVEGEKVLLLDGNDRLGMYDEDGKFVCNTPGGDDKLMGSPVDSKTLSIFGSGVWTMASDTYSEDRRFSNSLKLTGTLYIKDTAKVALGGQYKIAESAVYDYYMGIIADAVIVDGTTPEGDGDYVHLEATMANIKKLTVKGGNVQLHHDSSYNSGNGNGGYSDHTSKKMVEITEQLQVAGGNVYIGRNGPPGSADDLRAHYINSLMGNIIQSGGNLVVTGKTILGAAIHQTGGSMSIADGSFIKLSSSISITQDCTGEHAGIPTLNLGKLQATNFLGKISYGQISISQTGNGVINLVNGATFTTRSASTASSITQSGGGTVNLTGDFSSAVFNVDLSEGLLNLTSNGTKLKSNVISIASGTATADGTEVIVDGAFLESNGIMTVGTESAGTTKAGGLYVTSGGTLNTTLNGDSAAIHVVDNVSGLGITEWTMASGSVFGIALADDYNELMIKEDNSTPADGTQYTLSFENVLVAEGKVDLSKLNNTFDLGQMNGNLWKFVSAEWSQNDDETKTYVSGTLTFDPTVDITEGGEDANAYGDLTAQDQQIKVSMTISEKDVILSGDNSHSGGTVIDNVTVTLGHENALGTGKVSTTGANVGLVSEAGITAKLPEIVQNSGDLTMQGRFSSDTATVYNGEVPDSYICVDDLVGNNGFKREGQAYQIVQNEEGATLTVESGTSVTVKDVGELKLFTDGLASALSYDTYYIRTAEHVVNATEIHEAAEGRTTDGELTTVEMQDGKLMADASIEVQATGGTLATSGAETVVSGSLCGTQVEAAGGTIEATIADGEGEDGAVGVKVTGDTTLAAENSYSGGTVVNNAELVVANAGGLGRGHVQLEDGATLDLCDQAFTNDIIVFGCTLRGGSAYAGRLILHNDLTLDGPTTASAVEVHSGKRTNLVGDLSLQPDGSITLSNGSVLNVTGSLTLAGTTTLTLLGNYAPGTTLVSAEGGLEAGDVELVYNDPRVMLERIGNSLVLTLKFKQDIADAVAQGNWGIATASRSFVNAIRGQRNNTGCIANGRGTAWFSLLGARNNLKGADVSIEGAAVGADMKLGSSSVLGVAFGYAEGKVSPSGLSKVSQDGYYAAVYGEHALGRQTPKNGLALDWVLAYGTTESDYRNMSWEQDSLQLNARVTRSHAVSERAAVNAFAGLEYFATDSDTVDGVKTGSIQNLRAEVGIGASYVAWGTPTLLDAKTGEPLSRGCEKLVLHGEVSYFNDLVRHNPVIRMNGESGCSGNPGRHGVELGVGATYRINERWSASANYSFSAMEDSREHHANIGASLTF